MNRARRFVVGLTVASLLIGCGAVLLFNWSALGWKTLAVPTGSMRPSIPPGSLVLMHRVPATSLKVGDVITYINPRNPKKTVTHRIIKAYTLNGKIPAFVTKGDANQVADPPVVGGLVLGKTVWHIPYAGSWMMWSKTWLGIAVLVYLPALLIVIEEVGRLAEYLRLLQPYQVPGFHPTMNQSSKLHSLAGGATGLSVVIVLASVFVWQPALALLKSNTVALTNNQVSVTTVQHQCSGHNNTSVSVTNNSNQTAQTGNAASSGNTTGGAASSGNASNSNSTNTSVTVTNCG